MTYPQEEEILDGADEQVDDKINYPMAIFRQLDRILEAASKANTTKRDSCYAYFMAVRALKSATINHISEKTKKEAQKIETSTQYFLSNGTKQGLVKSYENTQQLFELVMHEIKPLLLRRSKEVDF